MSNTDPSVERASQASKNSDRAVRKHVGRLQRQIATALEVTCAADHSESSRPSTPEVPLAPTSSTRLTQDMAKGMEAGLESERAHLALMQRQIDSQAIRLQRTVEVLSARQAQDSGRRLEPPKRARCTDRQRHTGVSSNLSTSIRPQA